MPKHMRNALTLMFLTICTLFTLSSIGPTINYTKFYHALQSIDSNISDITWQNTEKSEINISITLVVTNPTDYEGLELRSVQITGIQITFENTNDSVDVNGVSVFYKYIPINSHSNVTVPQINLNVKGQAAVRFSEFSRDYRGNIKWDFPCAVLISTFMDVIRIPFDLSYSQTLP